MLTKEKTFPSKGRSLKCVELHVNSIKCDRYNFKYNGIDARLQILGYICCFK